MKSIIITFISTAALLNSVAAQDHIPTVQREQPANVFGAPVRDTKGAQLVYTREQVETLAASVGKAHSTTEQPLPQPLQPSSFVPPSGAQQPFWAYAIFGSAIGASGIVVIPPATPPDMAEIVIGGNSTNNFGGGDFWQVIRRNATTGNYDTVFVSSTYTTAPNPSLSIKRIAAGNLVGNSDLELAVMLSDGRIYLYDLRTRAELGYISTGVSSLEAMTLADLDGDGLAEVIATTTNDLYVFSGSGNLLWQLAGAGGYDVVAGQMDNDAALEIATTSGKVVDAATRTVQWTRTTGFGRRLKLAPFPGESYQQLIVAESWSNIYSYDIARQLPRWSITTPQDIGTIEVADVDGDAIPELLVGDGQWGSVRAYDLMTQAVKWPISNPEHGVAGIAVGDVDGDGVVDLLWGAGWSSTGSDHLYVANTTGSRAIKWTSPDLQGPFVGPVIGDIDGDGQAELVVCSYSSESSYYGGKVLVFDLATLSLRGISGYVGGTSGRYIFDLKLRDVDNDGVLDIVAVGSSYSNGAITVFGFNRSNVFTTKWSSTSPATGSSGFNFADVADLDGNGTQEIIGASGSFLYVYNYPATTHSWQSLNLANSITGLIVQDLDGIGGSKEIAALVNNGDLYTFDGPSRQLRNLRQATGATVLANRVSPWGIVTAENTGLGRFLRYSNDSYTESLTRQLATGPFNGISVLPNGSLATGAGYVLSLRTLPSYSSVAWQSPAFGYNFGRSAARQVRNGENCLFSSARHALVGFTYPHDALALLNAASRKVHGATSGGQDTALALNGPATVESRSGGANGDHTLVLTFNNDVVSGSAEVTAGIGAVSGSPIVSGNTLIVNLTNVANAQSITVTLNNVTDSFGQTATLPVSMGLLLGDTTGNGTVNASDIAQTKSYSGQAIGPMNLRADINVSGSVNASDIGLVKSAAGTVLAP